MLRSTISVTTTGTTGAATGNATVQPIPGELHALWLNYASTITATNTIRLKMTDTSSEIFSLVGATGSGWYMPRETFVTNTGAVYTSTGGLGSYPITGQITLTMTTGAPATNAVVAHVYTKQ